MDEFRARDLAHELAKYGLPQRSNLLLERETRYLEYLYYLLNTTEPLYLWRRLIAATLFFRLPSELATLRLQRKILSLGSLENAPLGVIRHLITSEAQLREKILFGEGLDQRLRLTLGAIPTLVKQRQFLKNVRRGVIVDVDGQFVFRAEGRITRCNAIAMIGLSLWMGSLTCTMAAQGADNFSLLPFVACSALACVCFRKTLKAAVSETRSVVQKANATLSPRRARP